MNEERKLLEIFLYRDGEPVPGELRENIASAIREAIASDPERICTLEIGSEALGRKVVAVHCPAEKAERYAGVVINRVREFLNAQ